MGIESQTPCRYDRSEAGYEKLPREPTLTNRRNWLPKRDAVSPRLVEYEASVALKWNPVDIGPCNR
jgi:hypothetical protein